MADLPIGKAGRRILVKILLVDDSRVILHENQRALEQAGFEVICREDGESALEIAHEQEFDLIVLDLMLPKMGGVEVLRHLKANPSTAAMPVVIVSSLSGKNRSKLLAEGAEDYFEKNTLLPELGRNLLPAFLENVICRVKRRRGAKFESKSAGS
jgi:DNA-binding response OmpR family regulator